MKVSILKHMRKNYSVVQLKDPTMEGKEVFRLLKNGRIVDYAWLPVKNYEGITNNFRLLIIGEAFGVNWEHIYYSKDKAEGVKDAIKTIKKRKQQILLKKKRNSIVSRAKSIWP